MNAQPGPAHTSPQEQRTCPQCGRAQEGARNFCPYCGHSFIQQTQPPAPPPQQGPTPPVPTPRAGDTRSASPSPPASPRRFRLVDLRVGVGLFGAVDLVVIAILVFLLLKPPFLPNGERSLCDQLDLSEFTPEKFQRGLGGPLEQDTVFSGNAEYLIQKTLEVPAGRRLLVQAGAVLEFDAEAALDVKGSLYVCGTRAQPVTLTSDQKKAGSWPGIRFYGADDDSVISHALIQFTTDKAIYLENSAPHLLDVKIAQGSGFPLSSDGNRFPPQMAEVDLDDNPFKGIEIRGGTLTEETIRWPNSGLVYVISGPLEVGSNTTLDIEPGTIVKFWQAPRANPPGIGVRGLLRAEGVTFTSIYDSRDAVGGTTYHQSQDPEPGDWAGIGFSESSDKSYLRQCTILYAGHGGQAAVAIRASSPELRQVTISDSAWYPLSADGDSFPVLEQISATDNDPANALEMRANSAVTGRHERVWAPLGQPEQIVRVIRGDLTVEPEATLIIEPGVVLKFENNARLVVKGTLRAVGGTKDAERIVLTSLRDDDYGGKTDLATGPQDSRTWGGIVFSGADASSVLENAIVRYGPIVLNDASPRLVSNLICDCESAAIQASPSSAPELAGNELRDNAIDGLAIPQTRIDQDVRWSALGSPDAQVVRVLEGEITVAPGANLSIEPGAIVKVSKNGRLRIQGALWVFGEEGAPVSFTSLHDDSLGGDTNRRLQQADAGDWSGIILEQGGRAYFAHAVIRYAETGLNLRGGELTDVEGWLRILDGQDALWCAVQAHLPSQLFAEGNERDELQCPTQ